MHRLDRSSVAVPACLVNAQGRRYTQLRAAEKQEIREQLLALQRERCAYCEARTARGQDDGHIEHFRKQADDPNRAQAGLPPLDMHWPNLFWCCIDERCCGKHKDKLDGTGRMKKPDYQLLIDPAIEDPHTYLRFTPDGEVIAQAGGEDRARETIRVFHLDCAFLQASRKDVLAPYVNILSTLMTMGADALRDYVRRELASLGDRPFESVIRHFLERYA